VKKVEAIIKPFLADDVGEALVQAGITGMTITEVKGFGWQKGHTELYQCAEDMVDFLPKIKLELIVAESQVEQCIDTIIQGAQLDKMGDGKIFVTPISKIIRLRTCEIDHDAI